jgi:hypothetical protein
VSIRAVINSCWASLVPAGLRRGIGIQDQATLSG